MACPSTRTAVAAAVLLALPATAAPSAAVSLVSAAPVSATNPTYVSWNIDSSCNRGFHYTDFTNPNLRAAAGGLSPSRLRFGGSGNDALVYEIGPATAGACADLPTPPPPANASCGFGTPGCLNATHWAGLYGLAQASGTEFMFGVSMDTGAACAKGKGWVWNSTNAAGLLADLVAAGQTSVAAVELGNEANMCGNLEPSQQADALAALVAAFAASGWPAPPPALLGPDTAGVASWLPWLDGYLAAVRARGLPLHATTSHAYNGVTRADYNSPAQLDSLHAEMAAFVNATRAGFPGAQAWAGEHGPHGGGNDGSCLADAVCGTYASALWYADDMGARAARGYAQYQRQDLFGGAYGLTNSVTGARALNATEPVALRPDYWVAFLWKRTIGTAVYNVSSSSATLRAYGFAGAPPSPWAATACAGSPLQLVLVNLDNASAIDVGLPPSPGAGASSYAAWVLSPGGGGDPFGVASAVNGAPSPAVVDASAVDPASFLRNITAPPAGGPLAGGLRGLPPLGVAFVCYVAGGGGA